MAVTGHPDTAPRCSAGRCSPPRSASAVAGGLVVAVAGLIAIEAGWIDAGDDSRRRQRRGRAARPSNDGDGKGLTVNEIYERDADGVAFIQARQSAGAATGSGFVIDDEGHILTNAHVVEGSDEITVEVGEDGEHREAEVVGADPSSDVALLDVDEADDLHAARARRLRPRSRSATRWSRSATPSGSTAP